jgi:hypothetical protein
MIQFKPNTPDSHGRTKSVDMHLMSQKEKDPSSVYGTGLLVMTG